MSLLDKVDVAVTPVERGSPLGSQNRGSENGVSSPWLAQIIEHHMQTGDYLVAVKAASASKSRRKAEGDLLAFLLLPRLRKKQSRIPRLRYLKKVARDLRGSKAKRGNNLDGGSWDLYPISQHCLDTLEHLQSTIS